MDGMRILIIEDDLLIAAEIEEQLLDLGYVITDNVKNTREALLAFRRRLPDLVLSDIELKGSATDGIEIARQLNEIARVPIIFLTAYSDEATLRRAQSVKPAYFLVKPCSPTQLRVALDLALTNFSNELPVDPNHSLRYSPEPTQNVFGDSDCYFVKYKNRYVRIAIKDIIWVEALGSNVKIVTEDNSVVMTANLVSFIRQVGNDALVRIHRSFVINARYVTAFHSGNIFLSYNGKEEKLPIGKTYRESIKKLFPRLLSD